MVTDSSDGDGQSDHGDVRPGCAGENAWPGRVFCPKSLVVGLTGGIATGKSTVLSMFSDLGAQSLSADAIVHRLMAPDTDVWRAIVGEFGPEIVAEDGNIDRGRLGAIVFSDAGKRARLEAIVHPPVLSELAEAADRFREHGEGVLILEIPLLYETSAAGIVDRVIVVTAEHGTQVDRLQTRYGITQGEASLRISSQMPLSKKAECADWIVGTGCSLQATRREVSLVWRSLQKSLAQAQ